MDDNVCSICWESLSDNISILRCCPIRSYHASCLSNWNKISQSCPFCRVEHVLDIKPEHNYELAFEHNNIIIEQNQQFSTIGYLTIIVGIFIGCLIIFIIMIL